MSVVWLEIIAKYLINLTELIYLITSVKMYYLGLTLLAWGLSYNNFFISQTLSEIDFATIAIQGIFAS